MPTAGLLVEKLVEVVAVVSDDSVGLFRQMVKHLKGDVRLPPVRV